MPQTAEIPLIERRFKEAYGASPARYFENFFSQPDARGGGAALGYRRADKGALFLENYLDCPVERMLSLRLGREIERAAIVEIGNFASDNALAMVNLWAMAANDLGGRSEIAVATLTAPLRAMFGRIGVPIVELADARPEALGAAAARWGSYYETRPRVCAGIIADGQRAIAAYLARRCRSAAA